MSDTGSQFRYMKYECFSRVSVSFTLTSVIPRESELHTLPSIILNLALEHS